MGRSTHFPDPADPPVWETALTYSLLGFFALYAIFGYLFYYNEDTYTPPEHHQKVQKIATTSLLFIIGCALGVGFFSAYGDDPCETTPVGVAVAIMCVSFVIALAFSVWFCLSRGPDRERPDPAPGSSAVQP